MFRLAVLLLLATVWNLAAPPSDGDSAEAVHRARFVESNGSVHNRQVCKLDDNAGRSENLSVLRRSCEPSRSSIAARWLQRRPAAIKDDSPSPEH